jgi:hypothetical protein
MSYGKIKFKSSTRKKININQKPLISYFLILILILFSLSTLFSSHAISCPGGPGFISIRIDEGEEEQFASISNEKDDTVTFPALLEWRIPAGARIDFALVNLTVEIENGWPIEADKTSFIMKQGDYVHLKVNVTVPSGLPCNTIGYITLYINTTIFPGGKYLQSFPVCGLIKVEQYHLLDIQSGLKKLSVNKESQTIYRLNITNKGNGEDSIILNITNYDYLDKSGLDFEVSYPITVDSNRSITVDLLVKTNKNTRPGKYKIHISAESDQELNNKGTSNSTNITLILKVKDPLTLDDYIDLTNYGIVLFGFCILILILFNKRRKSKKSIWLKKQMKD